jgi:alpha-beta hydrolase superfamily lysophospholipase
MFDALSVALLLVALSALAVSLGGPKTPPPMTIVNEQFKAIDFSGLPPLLYYEANDGEQLAYRAYMPSVPTAGSVVLVHGSSGSSRSLHLLAKGFAAAGVAVYVPDIRGHGASGSTGTIAYVGQLEDDLEAFVRRAVPAAPVTLVGFSAGGGFVIRFAGSERQGLFHSYLLLSPFLGEDAPNLRPNGGGWVDVGMPRMLALAALNSVGIRWFNDLPVIRFALNEEAKTFLTPSYSYSLAENFRPQHDYEQNIRDIHRPCAVVAGAADDVFYTDRLKPTFRALGKPWPVTLLPGIGHAALTLDPRGIAAAVRAVQNLQERRQGS